jgi:exonuclease SbcC
MIKILHTGDIHLGDLAGPTKDGQNLRREDTIRCMREVYYRAFLEEPDVTIIAGDLFNRSRVWADTALEDVNDALEQFIIPLCKCSDAVVLLFGTMNHDNPRAFELIKRATQDLKNLHIYTEPKVEEITTSSGPVQIVAVPGFDKARLRLFCPGVDKETENRNATALINDIMLGLSTELDKSKPSVLVAHYTVSGSEADNGSTFLAGQDVVVLPATIDAMGVDLACFGHIHKPQRLACQTPAFYCGSVNQLTFNDEGTEHGFYIHTIDGQVSSEFAGTPERKHFTLRLSPEDVSAFITGGVAPTPDGISDAVVRVRYSCTAEQDKAFNRAELQKYLMQAGAFYVAEVMPEDVEELDAKDQLTEHDGPAECLVRWLETNGVEPDKAARLEELAAPIIKQADDGRGDSKHTGAFSPRSIEVKNYRSYTAATFDFEPVHMAMVNGPNGVGKSSLFMDALADCLYEQTRKEDIGGWVRDGTKSGSITFTFGLGGQDYRVIRTRTKSGRGTLALQRWDADGQAWADESDTTMKLTQARIERLLGMDCTTFCSIALIRQDAYGLFLEAGSDQRMAVLSALLGLDIYGRMEDLAKAGATEQRRKLTAIRERSAILDETIQQKAGIESEDAELADQVADVEKFVKDLEADLREAEAAEALRKEIARQADEKKRQAQEYRLQAADKASEYLDLEKQHSEAEAAADGLEDAAKAAERVKAARELMQRFAPDVERDKDLVKERTWTTSDLLNADQKVKRLESEKGWNELVLSKKGEISKAKVELAEIAAMKEKVRQRLSDMEKATAAYQRAKAACDAYLQEAKSDIRVREAEIKRARDEASRLDDSGCPVPETATCKFLASAVDCKQMLPGMIESLEDAKKKHRERYDELKANVDQAKAAIDEIGDPLDELSELEHREQELRSITSKEAEVAAAEASVEKIEASIKEAKEAADKAVAHIEEIDAEREKLTQAVTAYQEAEGDVASFSGLADTLAECQAGASKAEALAPQIRKLKEEVDELRGKSEQALREADEIAARVPGGGNVADRIRANIEAQRRSLTDLATRRGQLKAKLEDIAEAETKSSELRREAEAVGVVLSDYTTLAQAFGLDGIQYMIVRGVVPEIMHRSNEILAAMTGGRMAVDIRTEREQKSTKQVVNSLEVWINTITGGNRPYLSHSGGEKVKIALAVTLGLADVKARRAGVQLGMLYIDEPPFLDADGTEAYADALVAMASRNPNMRILAISHDPTMKARFVQNIVVTGGEDGSTVTME